VHARSTLALLLAASLCAGVAAAQDLPGKAKPRALLPETASAVQESDDPEAIYNLGMKQLKRQLWDDAILSFEKVRNRFPFNPYSVLAELRVADCLFEKAAYVEAVDAYRGFVKLHPRHAEVGYAVFRSAKAEMKLAPLVAQRDQAHTVQGLKNLEGFEQKYPDSPYLAEAGKLRRRGELRLSRAALQVGNFYWKRREWAAAERRYRLAAEENPGTRIAAKARFRQAMCLSKLDRPDEARGAAESAVASDPEGPWGKRARAAIERLPGPTQAP
jgi:outer membrane protein assembly factor BamD